VLAQSSRYEVHQAWSEARATPVAVKFARPSAGTEVAQALTDEGRLLSSLTHPHLVRAYEMHDAQCALVLELLPGPTLSDAFDNDGRVRCRDGVDLALAAGSYRGAARFDRDLHGI
jgi:serine/threonine protein kinase